MDKKYVIQTYNSNKPSNENTFLDFENVNNNLLFIIDFNSLNKKSAKIVIKKLQKLKNKANIGIYNKETNECLIARCYNYDKSNSFHNDLISSIYAVLKKDKREMYNYIYDKVCDNLDKEFIEKNLCEFIDDICGEKRNTSCMVGCCRHYKNKILGPLPFNKFIVCEYLKDKRCSAKCLSCKLFTCDYLN